MKTPKFSIPGLGGVMWRVVHGGWRVEVVRRVEAHVWGIERLFTARSQVVRSRLVVTTYHSIPNAHLLPIPATTHAFITHHPFSHPPTIRYVPPATTYHLLCATCNHLPSAMCHLQPPTILHPPPGFSSLHRNGQLEPNIIISS